MTEIADKLKLRTKQFALRVIHMVEALPRGRTGDVLGKQVLRSATSVGANYREAFQARSTAEFISKVGDCLRELEETAYWLELIEEADLLSANKLSALHTETNELISIFVTILKRKKRVLNS